MVEMILRTMPLPSTAVTVNAACRDSVAQDTIAFFSSAPLTLDTNVTDSVACASKCETLNGCESWLFNTGGWYDLFRNSAVATASSPHFVFGGCAKDSPRSSVVVSSIASATPIVANLHGKRHLEAHKKHGHSFHSH
ncbi:hypothetical protein DTO013E5_5348 [Penicillium roqueforti]|uniref:uncharacterized protein n=1 Tax=Penicillium roqueforti TaxID=5082 RepID=UPI00190D8408|nr:uncharacterized protein LCP9604111_8978 [Penicillium roqueforti]KAF9239958.1 hypothetical protein LCP9604111_8978 [Penicillium roqueforti]KAI1831430.1 hypothetical protein CBS147337_7896 [Penicillium roqueforti]KAI2671362.1 hypothetical protein CBS147355_8644 [Penicillium roqueforti]KAI2672872.1 hypothetical protein LCP963914a_9202 [Penicillium roqueforti]KAI2708294.1 hypothetical protein CBS147318_9604 [Penicillium roqueforti]